MKFNRHKKYQNHDKKYAKNHKYELINFTKMHGLGNDFMVIETITQQVHLTPELIQEWANRHTGIGFDQLLVLAPPTKTDIDFQYIIYNADGSEAGQCGNGARAIARFIYDQKLSLSIENTIETITNRMKVRILESGLSQIDMAIPEFRHHKIPYISETECKQPKQNHCSQQTLKVLDQNIHFYPISVGNPHAVIFVNNLNNINTALPEAIQQHPCFPESVNVGFAQVIHTSKIQLRVFERGAGETQACGSGATAAAIAALESKSVTGPEVEVVLKGGKLTIYWDQHTLQMTGPAVRVFTGRILVKNPKNATKIT